MGLRGRKRQKAVERQAIGTSKCVLSAKYYGDEQIVEYKMGRGGSMHGSCGKLTQSFFFGKL